MQRALTDADRADRARRRADLADVLLGTYLRLARQTVTILAALLVVAAVAVVGSGIAAAHRNLGRTFTTAAILVLVAGVLGGSVRLVRRWEQCRTDRTRARRSAERPDA